MPDSVTTSAPALMLHPRQSGLVASATLAINERRQALLAEGKTVFNFGLGQSPFPVPDRVVQSLRDNAHQKDYLPVRGLLSLRQAVSAWFARRFDLHFAADNILVAPGSKELLFLIQMALDSVLILPSPSWVSYQPQSRLAGNRAIWVDTHEEDDWCLRPAALLEACRGKLDGKTGILLLNYPNNPTGTTYRAAQLRALADAARELGILVLSDEIYAEVDHRGEHVSIARFYPQGTVVTTGLSKWCGAGGWRLGIAAFPDSLQTLGNTVAAMASETYTSASAPIQHAAVSAFVESEEIEQYVADSRRILAFVQGIVRSRLLSCGITVPEGTGGFYLFCNFENYREKLGRKGISDSAALAEALLMEAGFACLPGTAFGRTAQELSLRLSYVDFDGDTALQQVSLIESDPEGAVHQICPRIDQAMGALTAWLEAL